MDKKIKNFSDWWEVNGAAYEILGVGKILAKSIWSAAIDLTEEVLIEKIKEGKLKNPCY